MRPGVCDICRKQPPHKEWASAGFLFYEKSVVSILSREENMPADALKEYFDTYLPLRVGMAYEYINLLMLSLLSW